jgi:hypothetical protein
LCLIAIALKLARRGPGGKGKFAEKTFTRNAAWIFLHPERVEGHTFT